MEGPQASSQRSRGEGGASWRPFADRLLGSRGAGSLDKGQPTDKAVRLRPGRLDGAARPAAVGGPSNSVRRCGFAVAVGDFGSAIGFQQMN
jgi:hypothetical protein